MVEARLVERVVVAPERIRYRDILVMAEPPLLGAVKLTVRVEVETVVKVGAEGALGAVAGATGVAVTVLEVADSPTMLTAEI